MTADERERREVFINEIAKKQPLKRVDTYIQQAQKYLKISFF